MKCFYSPLYFHIGLCRGIVCVYYLYLADKEIDLKIQDYFPKVTKLTQFEI